MADERLKQFYFEFEAMALLFVEEAEKAGEEDTLAASIVVAALMEAIVDSLKGDSTKLRAQCSIVSRISNLHNKLKERNELIN